MDIDRIEEWLTDSRWNQRIVDEVLCEMWDRDVRVITLSGERTVVVTKQCLSHLKARMMLKGTWYE